MKNIHILPTDKPIKNVGDLVKDKYGDIHIFTKNDGKEYGKTTTKINIYITNDEEIKEGIDQWYLDKVLNEPYNSGGAQYSSKQDVIILTTDQDLIKDGVQAIDDEFLEWFVQNPSCEEVEVSYQVLKPFQSEDKGYMIHLPDNEVLQEPKQETLEEAYNKIYKEIDFSEFDFASFAIGVKYQQERSYSEKEIMNALHSVELKYNRDFTKIYEGMLEFLKEFKNK